MAIPAAEHVIPKRRVGHVIDHRATQENLAPNFQAIARFIENKHGKVLASEIA